ncbi:hypothetical protein Pmani_019543 [Petrolisthes manimaculis]|uniref:Major facilitator superfamily (MFS) profile domain-containing protein n=1 Tax=Petrolisthes manimaculis TaxID=1843537 RepID=A0AAE1PJE1_9EUCA|nr:hypothetical protein Pmani_019543 [Petrolisthes manimaculis]
MYFTCSETIKRWSLGRWVSLCVMSYVYLVGELSHFLLGIVTRPLSQELHYGDQACLPNPEAQHSSTQCRTYTNSSSCAEALESENITLCVWDYSGVGMQYQILAGPAFVFVFTTAGVVIGAISDKFNRKVVVTVCCGILTLATGLTASAQTYWHLVILRMLMGAGESSFTPACSSMISDMFPEVLRALALGIFNWGIYLGYGLSYAVGNFVTEADIGGLGWRWSYIVTGIMGVVATLLLFLVVPEPTRGGRFKLKSNTNDDDDEMDEKNNKTTTTNTNEEEMDEKNNKTTTTTTNTNDEEMDEKNNKTTTTTTTTTHKDTEHNKETDCSKDSSASPKDSSASSKDSSASPKDSSTSSKDSSASPKDSSASSASSASSISDNPGLLEGIKSLLKPPILVLCLAACIRHTAGFAWAYNTQQYFLTYYPDYNLGLWVTGASIVGGSLGVAVGGVVSDRLVKRIGIKARVYVLAASQLLASPFAAGVLYFPPPGAFFSLLGAYIFAEMWFGVLFAVFLCY